MSTNERSGIATHTGGTPLGRGAHIVIRHQRVPGSLKPILALVRATSRCFTQHQWWSSGGTAGADATPPAFAAWGMPIQDNRWQEADWGRFTDFHWISPSCPLLQFHRVHLLRCEWTITLWVYQNKAKLSILGLDCTIFGLFSKSCFHLSVMILRPPVKIWKRTQTSPVSSIQTAIIHLPYSLGGYWGLLGFLYWLDHIYIIQ